MKFKLILRNLWKTKFYSSLNILGLAIGMSVAIITFLYLQSEWTYDKHYSKHDRIFRVGSSYVKPAGEDRYALSGMALGKMLKEEFTEIESFVRFNFISEKWLFQYNNESYFLDGIHETDSTALEIFDFDFIQGDPNTALDGRNSLVLSETVAKRIFGEEDPMGKSLKFNRANLMITGVYRDLPKNTHFVYHGLMSTYNGRGNFGLTDRQSLNSIGDYTYILLKEGTSIETVKARMPEWIEKYGQDPGEDVESTFHPIIEPLTDIHFNSDLPYDRPQGNMSYLYAFLSVGLLILLLASINYVNLATARATSRAKEIGVKKVSGATKPQLIQFFMLESLFITAIACVLALGLTELVFNVSNLNSLLDKDLALNLFSNPELALGILGIFVLVSLLAGLYPAFYLSNIEPMGVLKGAFKNTSSGVLLRRTLVVFQFMISIGVVGITLLMGRQIDYLRDKDLGFDKENVINIPIRSRAVAQKITALKQKFRDSEYVKGITLSNQVPGIYVDRSDFMIETDEGMERVPTSYMSVDHDYLEVFGTEIVEGRNFDVGRSSDSTFAMIVNETFVKKQGWENPVGKKFVAREDSLGNRELGQIVGVVEDFNTNSLHEPMLPIALFVIGNVGRNIFVRIKEGNPRDAIQDLTKQWREVIPDLPMEFSFLDDDLNVLYNSDERQSKLLFWLSIICGLISSLGLFGLASFTTAQRTKEMGVRKVLGASVSQIVGLLFKEVLLIVAVAAVVALPVIYFSYNSWVETFAYRLGMDFLLVFLVSLLAIGVAFLTISYHASRLASTNPVHSLRTE